MPDLFQSIQPAPGGELYPSPSLTGTYDRTTRRAYEAAGLTPPTLAKRLPQAQAHLDELASLVQEPTGAGASLEDFRRHALDLLLVANRDQIEAQARIADQDPQGTIERVEQAWHDIRPALAKTLAEAQKAAKVDTPTGQAQAQELLAKVDAMVRVLPGIVDKNAHAAFLTTTVDQGEDWQNFSDPAPVNPSEERDQLREFLALWDGDTGHGIRRDRTQALVHLLAGRWPLLHLDLAQDGAEVKKRADKVREAVKRYLLPEATANAVRVLNRASVTRRSA